MVGLGAESLTTLEYTIPLFMVLIGIRNGIGAGGNSLISIYIGVENTSQAKQRRYTT